MFIDATGGLVKKFDSTFRDSISRSDTVLHTLFWVPVPGGGAPFVVLEQISNDQSAANLLKSILDLDKLQQQHFGDALRPVRVNVDCGLALLVAAVEGWNKESVEEYLIFTWDELRSKGFVDWAGRCIVSWCNRHIVEAIKLWIRKKLESELFVCTANCTVTVVRLKPRHSF